MQTDDVTLPGAIAETNADKKSTKVTFLAEDSISKIQVKTFRAQDVESSDDEDVNDRELSSDEEGQIKVKKDKKKSKKHQKKEEEQKKKKKKSKVEVVTAGGPKEDEKSDDDDEDANEDGIDEETKSKAVVKQGALPPLPVHGNLYFIGIVCSMIGTIIILFWSWMSHNTSGRTFGFFFAANATVLACLIVAYRSVIIDKVNLFISQWYDKERPKESKIHNIITITATNSWLQYINVFLILLNLLTWLFCLLDLVLGDEVFSHVNDMSPESKAQFSLLIISVFSTIIFTLFLLYSIQNSITRGCSALEAYSYEKAIEGQMSLFHQFQQQKATPPPLAQ